MKNGALIIKKVITLFIVLLLVYISQFELVSAAELSPQKTKRVDVFRLFVSKEGQIIGVGEYAVNLETKVGDNFIFNDKMYSCTYKGERFNYLNQYKYCYGSDDVAEANSFSCGNQIVHCHERDEDATLYLIYESVEGKKGGNSGTLDDLWQEDEMGGVEAPQESGIVNKKPLIYDIPQKIEVLPIVCAEDERQAINFDTNNVFTIDSPDFISLDILPGSEIGFDASIESLRIEASFVRRNKVVTYPVKVTKKYVLKWKDTNNKEVSESVEREAVIMVERLCTYTEVESFNVYALNNLCFSSNCFDDNYQYASVDIEAPTIEMNCGNNIGKAHNSDGIELMTEYLVSDDYLKPELPPYEAFYNSAYNVAHMSVGEIPCKNDEIIINGTKITASIEKESEKSFAELKKIVGNSKVSMKCKLAIANVANGYYQIAMWGNYRKIFSNVDYANTNSDEIGKDTKPYSFDIFVFERATSSFELMKINSIDGKTAYSLSLSRQNINEKESDSLVYELLSDCDLMIPCDDLWIFLPENRNMFFRCIFKDDLQGKMVYEIKIDGVNYCFEGNIPIIIPESAIPGEHVVKIRCYASNYKSYIIKKQKIYSEIKENYLENDKLSEKIDGLLMAEGDNMWSYDASLKKANYEKSISQSSQSFNIEDEYEKVLISHNPNNIKVTSFIMVGGDFRKQLLICKPFFYVINDLQEIVRVDAYYKKTIGNGLYKTVKIGEYYDDIFTKEIKAYDVSFNRSYSQLVKNSEYLDSNIWNLKNEKGEIFIPSGIILNKYMFDFGYGMSTEDKKEIVVIGTDNQRLMYSGYSFANLSQGNEAMSRIKQKMECSNVRVNFCYNLPTNTFFVKEGTDIFGLLNGDRTLFNENLVKAEKVLWGFEIERFYMNND